MRYPLNLHHTSSKPSPYILFLLFLSLPCLPFAVEHQTTWFGCPLAQTCQCTARGRTCPGLWPRHHGCVPSGKSQPSHTEEPPTEWRSGDQIERMCPPYTSSNSAHYTVQYITKQSILDNKSENGFAATLTKEHNVA